jgi:hypothetical protein
LGTFSSLVRYDTARWPRLVSSSSPLSSLVDFCAETYSTRIWTIDKRCWVELDKSRRIATVSYPVPLASVAANNKSKKLSEYYVAHEQTFVIFDSRLPDCWKFPLGLLLSFHGGKFEIKIDVSITSELLK